MQKRKKREEGRKRANEPLKFEAANKPNETDKKEPAASKKTYDEIANQFMEKSPV